MRSGLWRSSVVGWAVALALAVPASAVAQSWEVEVHGGVGTSGSPAAGSGSVPGTGSASAASVSSWYLGDGALALNEALSSFGLSQAVSALDATLQGPLVAGGTGGVFGVRLDRVLTPRFSVEFSVDSWLSPLQMTTTNRSAIDAASASFTDAWNALLSGPARGTQVVSSSTSVTQRDRQIVPAAGLVINFTKDARVTPYATVGAGVVMHYGTAPGAQLVGSYQFSVVPSPDIPGPAPAKYHETDTVTVSAPANDEAVGVLGFGVKIAAGGRWGVRIDVRDLVGRSTSSTTVTAAPSSQVSQPTGVFVLGTSPPLQFSTVSGLASTLSLPVSNVTTFSSTGVRNQVAVTAGLSWRF